MSNILHDLERIWRSLPPHPVAPEHRRYARLRPSAYVPKGQMYRVLPDAAFFGEDERRPLIVMNDKDVDVLRAVVTMPLIDVDQEIADVAEQLFAEQEARSR